MKFSDMPYSRVDASEFEASVSTLMQELDSAPDGAAAFAVHEKFYKLHDKMMTMMTLAEIRHDIDMKDPVYEAEQDFYDAQGPVFRNLVTDYGRKLFASPYRGFLTEKIGPVAFKNVELAMRAMNEELIPLCKEENELTTRYGKLLATAEIDWHGEKLNLSLMNPYLHSADRAVRKEAWEKYVALFTANEDELDEIYDRLIKNRTAQGRKMGYDTYVPLGYDRMNRNSYGRSEIEEFRKQVKTDWVPFAEKIHEARRVRLGLDRLSYIDEGVSFLNGNPKPVGTPEEILAAGGRMYGKLSPETAEFYHFMRENELFDVLGRKTKRVGGYMTFLPDYNAPFIFANFNGTSGDVDVITHECGHAFQGYLAAKDPIREHMDITMETAEIHSMSMEFFTEPWMEMFFGERADDYRKMHFEDAAVFIPYGTMVDEFQHIVYDDPGLTPKARKATWRDLEKQYKPHLNYDGCPYYEAGGFWQKQHHIYDLPFYYIDYCLAQTCALEYKNWMDRDYQEAWQSYLKLCNLSASDFYGGLLKKAGLEIPFEDGCLAHLARGLEEKLLG